MNAVSTFAAGMSSRFSAISSRISTTVLWRLGSDALYILRLWRLDRTRYREFRTLTPIMAFYFEPRAIINYCRWRMDYGEVYAGVGAHPYEHPLLRYAEQRTGCTCCWNEEDESFMTMRHDGQDVYVVLPSWVSDTRAAIDRHYAYRIVTFARMARIMEKAARRHALHV